MATKIRPLQDRVIVKRVKEEEKTKKHAFFRLFFFGQGILARFNLCMIVHAGLKGTRTDMYSSKSEGQHVWYHLLGGPNILDQE